MMQQQVEADKIRTTVRMPSWLHDEFRREAFETRRPLNELLVEALTKRYKPTDAPTAHNEGTDHTLAPSTSSR